MMVKAKVISERSFHKGDKVAFRHGIYEIEGIVKEDRGRIGINGRHLYVVEFRFGEGLSRAELPAAQLRPVQDGIAAK
jgi:hypothetical protein